jgi:hypothetical protein
MAALKEITYKGRDNSNSVRFNEDKKDGAGAQSIDFSAVTRYVLLLTDGVLSETIDVTPIDGRIVGDAEGVIIFKLKDISLDEGEYFARLTVYDPAHTDGQIIVHEDKTAIHDRLIFSLHDA